MKILTEMIPRSKHFASQYLVNPEKGNFPASAYDSFFVNAVTRNVN